MLGDQSRLCISRLLLIWDVRVLDVQQIELGLLKDVLSQYTLIAYWLSRIDSSIDLTKHGSQGYKSTDDMTTVVSDRSNVVEDLNEQVKLSVLHHYSRRIDALRLLQIYLLYRWNNMVLQGEILSRFFCYLDTCSILGCILVVRAQGLGDDWIFIFDQGDYSLRLRLLLLQFLDLSQAQQLMELLCYLQ